MQDRLKFRVWDKYFNRYWTDEEVKNNIQWLLYPDNDNIENVVIEQCTGLKDKSGNLVYEGDIVKLHARKFMWEVKYDVRYGQFIYERQSPETIPPSPYKPSFIADDFSSCLICWTETKGNIHENHELLEKKDD